MFSLEIPAMQVDRIFLGCDGGRSSCVVPPALPLVSLEAKHRQTSSFRPICFFACVLVLDIDSSLVSR